MRGRDIRTGKFSANGALPTDVLSEKLERLAIRLADQLLGERDPDDPDRKPLTESDLAAMKLLTLYYGQSRRLPTQKTDDDDDEHGFGALKDRIHGARDNETQADC